MYMITEAESKIFLHYLHPYRLRIIKISLLAIICALFEAVNLGALVPLIQMLNSTTEPQGNFWQILKTLFSFIGLELTFVNLLLVMGILFLIGQVLLYFKKQAQARLWFTFSADLKKKLFSRLLETDIQYHYTEKSGKFLDILNRQTEYAATSIFAATEIITFFFFIIVYSAILLYISVELTLICIGVALISLYALNSYIVRSKQMGILSNEINIRLNEFVSERLGLIKLIKTFSTEDCEIKKYESMTGEYSRNTTNFLMNGVKIESIFQVIIFSIAIIILYVSTAVLSFELSLLLVFIFTLIRLTDPLRQINAKRHEIAGELASLEKIDEVFKDSGNYRKIVSGKREFTSLQYSIELQKVNFAYTEKKVVLHDITFSVRKNEMVALVGPSGGGKSTIVDLIIRLIDPDRGTILIDSIDLRELNLDLYHRRIGFVGQESLIFNDTVLNNICYGSGVISTEKAKAAAAIANAHEFITQLPEQYETVLGERGVTLSGGQKQRIALARAIYKNPEILILDEATSALDSESEKTILDAIKKIRHTFTIIAIAHRLSTIENADRIVVIEDGNIVEAGTHEELLASGNTYQRYYQLQYNTQRETQ